MELIHLGASRLEGNFVLLHAGPTCLLLPQDDVEAVEHRDAWRESSAANAAAWPAPEPGAVRTVALSESLTPLAEPSADRFLVTRLRGAPEGVDFAWSAVRVLAHALLECHPLPPAMAHADALVDGYVEIDGVVALCSTAERLVGHVLAAAA